MGLALRTAESVRAILGVSGLGVFQDTPRYTPNFLGCLGVSRDGCGRKKAREPLILLGFRALWGSCEPLIGGYTGHRIKVCKALLARLCVFVFVRIPPKVPPFLFVTPFRQDFVGGNFPTLSRARLAACKSVYFTGRPPLCNFLTLSRARSV